MRTIARGSRCAMESRRDENGAPTLSKVLAEAEEWRKEEFQQARDALGNVGDEESEFAAEIRIASHDVLKPGHGRDYRGFVLFYQDMFCRIKLAIRVFDLRNRDEGGGLYHHCKLLHLRRNGGRNHNG